MEEREGERGGRENIIIDDLMQHEAAKVMQDAINEFTDTSEEFRYELFPLPQT